MRAAKRFWLEKEINHDSIPQAAADNVGQRWATHHDLPRNSPVCGLFCVCYKPRPARTTIASQVWIQFFLVLNLHALDVVLRQDLFDAMGNFLGTLTIRQKITLIGQDDYVGVGNGETRDAFGVILSSRCATIRGVRIKVEPLAEQCQSIVPPQ